MRIELITGMQLLIIAFLAYVPTVTLSGWFAAWTAKKCDDDTPENLGFLTLDPFVHFSFFGFTLLLVGKFFGQFLPFLRGFPGFGRFIIFDPMPGQSIKKVALEFFARAIAHLAMLSCAFILLVGFKGSINSPAFLMPLSSSLFDAITLILYFFFEQNELLFIIYCLIGFADTVSYAFQIPRYFSFKYFGVLLGSFILLSDLFYEVLGLYLKGLQKLLMIF